MSEPIPPLRQWDGQHGVPDDDDAARIALVRDRWAAQDQALLARDKTVEENVRMLAGRQWDVWVPTLGTFVDATRYMTDSEKRWRQRPVINVLLYWFLLTHARLTESAPVVGFQPATADEMDRRLAQTMETVFKTLWQGELQMDDRFTAAAAWLLAGGEVYAETCAEYGDDAPTYQLTAPATLSMQREDGTTIERDTGEPVPYDAAGNPLAQLAPDPDAEGEYGYELTEPLDGEDATPATVREGTPKVTILSPLEVRAEWGANTPWEEKRWIIVRRYLPVAEVERRYGVTVPPDVAGAAAFGSGGSATANAGTLTRMLFGAGNFGAVGNNLTAGDASQSGASGGYVTVDTLWEQPDPKVSPASDESAGGRMLVVTPTVVLHDSARPYKTQAAGPIRRAQFVQVPGRAGLGSTPLEQLVPIQKTYNRGWAQILEHRNRCTNPILIYDANSGFADQAENVPGAMLSADFSGLTREPAYYLAPPPLSADVWRIQDMLFQLLLTLGSLHGAEGQAPTENASGELVSQLRFNADRPLGTAARSLASFLAGIADDLVAVLPTCWPAEKVITYAGDDAILQTLTVMPELWSGRVNARPDLQNALTETVAAKQARIFRDWQAGAFGDPFTEGAKKYLELSQYPHADRASLTGGPDRRTAERFLAELVQGAPAAAIQSFLQPWYNYDVLLETTRAQLAAPEFLNYEPAVQAELSQFFQMVLAARAQALAFQAQTVAGPAVMAQAAVQGQAQTALAATSPAPAAGVDSAAGEHAEAPAVGPARGPSPAQAA